MNNCEQQNTYPAYRIVRHNNDEQQQQQSHQPSTSNGHVVAQIAPRITQTTQNILPRPSSNNQSIPPYLQQIGTMPIGAIVVGEKILTPAGTLVLPSSDANNRWHNQRLIFTGGQPTTIPARAGMAKCVTTPSHHGGGPVHAIASNRRLVTQNPPKIVQAVPFPVSSPSTQPTSTSSHWYIANTNQPLMVHHPKSTTSSATPDSGIQSVPTSPPNKDLADFADMPILRPAVDTEDDEDSMDMKPCTSAPQSVTPLPDKSPSVVSPADPVKLMPEFDITSISNSSDPTTCQNIVSQLMRDPEKAKSLFHMLRQELGDKDSGEGTSGKKVDNEAEVSSTTPTVPRTKVSERKRVRKVESPEETVVSSTLSHDDTEKEEVVKKRRAGGGAKRRGGARTKVEVEVKKRKVAEVVVPEKKEEKEEEKEPTAEELEIKYRMAIQERIEQQLNKCVELMTEDMSRWTICSLRQKSSASSFLNSLHRTSSRMKKSILMKRREKKKQEEEVKKEMKDEPKIRSRLSSRRMTKDEVAAELTIESRFNGEYDEIPRSIASSEDIIPLWKSPSLTCGCTKGACTSDVDCLNRALRVQCGNECTTNCINRKFWKEDTSKLGVSNGPRSKRYLKTRVSKKPGELLCEYAGEVIRSGEAARRCEESSESRILALTAELFIDSTKKGNVGRFVKHSCRPNSRLEVWSIGGVYRAGIFTLHNIAANCEVTIDKSHLIPLDMPCNCGVQGCKQVIKASKNAAIISLSTDGNPYRRFLERSRRKTVEHIKKASGIPMVLARDESKGSPTIHERMRKVFKAIVYKVRNIDGSMPFKYLNQYNSICQFIKSDSDDPSTFVALIRKLLEVVDDDDIDNAFIAIQNKWLPIEAVEKAKRHQKLLTPSVISPLSSLSPSCSKRGDADLSYLESFHPIGSYDPDDSWHDYKANANDNAVRCVCGSLDEDGDMLQCDECHFWLHIDCVNQYIAEEDTYHCDFCNGSIPDQKPCIDVQLKSQPDVRFQDCVYYKALVNRRGIQVRLNETVYVNRRLPEDHKVLLRNLQEEKKNKKREKSKFKFPDAPTEKLALNIVEKKDARIFRVERLFVTPGNNRFVFGSFYAWPHETYVDTQKMFSQKEVFATALYETLPLDEVIGRCMVIDAETWRIGRPKVPKFQEDDVFLCESQLGKNQRAFEKVPNKNKYPINTQPYVFDYFPSPMNVIRDFRPYDSPTKSSKSVSPMLREAEKEKKIHRNIASKNLDKILNRLQLKKPIKL